MKQLYHHKEDTHLKFHKFFWYVSLPLGFISLLFNMLSAMSGIVSFDWLYAVDIGWYVIALTLMLVCFIGFFGWKSYAWYGVMILLCINIAHNLFVLATYAMYAPDQIRMVAIQFVSTLIYAILVIIYYKKRRPLFFADLSKIDTSDSPDSANLGELNSPKY